jgi:sirohydrochlorin cobaltochelatase
LDSKDNQPVGYLVVGHGTRSRSGQEQVRTLFSQMIELKPAELAFLELSEPDIPTAVERLFHAGVRRLVVVPVLLFSAGHAQQDIPVAVEAAASRFGITILHQCSSLCLDPSMVSLSAERFHHALAEHAGLGRDSNLTAEGVGLAMIGRGSSSEAATAAMVQFAMQRTKATPVSWSSVGFIHAQRPTVDEALDGLADTGLPWLVVQPHLLFEGELIDDLRRQVEHRQSFSPSQTWIVTETLGSTSLDQRLAATLSSLALRSISPLVGDSDSCARCKNPNQFCRVQ